MIYDTEFDIIGSDLNYEKRGTLEGRWKKREEKGQFANHASALLPRVGIYLLLEPKQHANTLHIIAFIYAVVSAFIGTSRKGSCFS